MAHYTYGSGMFGCLYDNGPEVAETLDDAIAGALFPFEDLPPFELQAAEQALQAEGFYAFKNPREAGAHYVEVETCTCQSPDHLDYIGEG